MTDTPSQWDAAERQSLLDRATKLADANGLKIENGAALVDQLDANGVSIFFHHHRSDAEVLARLQALCKPVQAADAVASPFAAAERDSAFTAWLGALADGFDKMPAVRKMQLARDFAAGVRSQSTAAQPGADTRKMTPAQKLAYAHASNQTAKTQRVAPVAPTAAMAGMDAKQRLQNLDLTRSAQRIARELAGLKASSGGSYFVQSARAAAIAKCEAQIVALQERGVVI